MGEGMTESGTREQILQTAGEIFAERGFQRATIRLISQHAGVNVAAVNYHFGDKQSLYLEAVRHAYATRSHEVPLPEWSEEIPAEQRLRDFVATLMTRMLGDEQIPWQSRLLMREVLQPTQACQHLVREHFRPQVETLMDVVRMLVPESVSRERIRQMAFSIIGQCLFYRVAGPVVSLLVRDEQRSQHYNLPQLVDHIVSFSLAALRTLDGSGPEFTDNLPLSVRGGLS